MNRVHNKWRTYYENKDKKGGPPHLKKAPSTKVVVDLRKNVDDILWCELNQQENKYVKQHERIEITFAEQLH